MGPLPNCNPSHISARAELNGTVDTAIQALAAKATFSIFLFTGVPFLVPTFPEPPERGRANNRGYESGVDGTACRRRRRTKVPSIAATEAPKRPSLFFNVRLYSFFFS